MTSLFSFAPPNYGPLVPVRPVPGLGWWGTGANGGFGPAPETIPAWASPNFGRTPGSTSVSGNIPTSSVYGGSIGGGSGSNIPYFDEGTGTPRGGHGNDMLQGGTPGFTTAIQELLAKGLVPDVARQSAEVAAGRGVAGSPAGASTAVRMSEQDYLARLGLANTLASGESSRTLPYQITPYQQALLELQRQQLQNQRDLGLNRAIVNQTRGVGGGGGGNRNAGGYSGGVSGGGGNMLTGTPGYFGPTGGFGAGGNPFSSGGSNSYLFGLGGGGGQSLTLDDIYEELGFGNFGSLPGDQSTEPPDFSYDMWD